jgi:hypothetical protein
MMDHFANEVLAELLASQVPGLARPGPGWTPSAGWPVFYGSMPAQPDSCVCVFNTQGVQNAVVQQTGEVVEHHGVQVLIRGLPYTSVRTTAFHLAAYLERFAVPVDVTYLGAVYRFWAAMRTSSVIDLPEEPDGKGRRRVSVNYLLSIQEVGPA